MMSRKVKSTSPSILPSALGPLSSVFDDATVTELVVNGHEMMTIQRGTESSQEPRPFDATRLKSLVRKIGQTIGQPLGSERSYAQAYLGSGLKIAVVSSELLSPGPMIVVRRVPLMSNDLHEMVKCGQLGLRASELLHHCVKIGCNILVVGPSSSIRRTLLAKLAGLWAEQARVIALQYPFYTNEPQTNIVHLNGASAIDSITPFLGDVIVADEPESHEWAPLMLKEQAFLAAHESASMSQGVRSLLSRITYSRPGMVMTGVEALLTSSIDLIVHCDEERLIGLGELQHWGSQLAVRALGKVDESEFLLDLRDSALRERLREAAPGLNIEGIDLEADASSAGVGMPLGIKPVVTTHEKRRVSSAFIDDNAERFVAEQSPLVKDEDAEAPAPDSALEPEEYQPTSDADVPHDVSSATQIDMSAGVTDDNDEEELALPQELSEADLELGTEMGEADSSEEEVFVDDMPSVAYSLALDEDDNAVAPQPKVSELESPFDEPTPALVLEDDDDPVAERFGGSGQVEAQATMIISQDDVEQDRFAPSDEDVQAGTGRPGTRSRRRNS